MKTTHSGTWRKPPWQLLGRCSSQAYTDWSRSGGVGVHARLAGVHHSCRAASATDSSATFLTVTYRSPSVSTFPWDLTSPVCIAPLPSGNLAPLDAPFRTVDLGPEERDSSPWPSLVLRSAKMTPAKQFGPDRDSRLNSSLPCPSPRYTGEVGAAARDLRREVRGTGVDAQLRAATRLTIRARAVRRSRFR